MTVHARALLIDAMGTLLRLEDPVPPLRAGLRERCGIEIDAEDAARGLAAEIAHYRAHMQRGRDRASVADLHRDCAGVLRDALGVRVDLGTMTEVLLGALVFAAWEDAPAALARARAAGARVIAVSNWDASLPDVLARVGLLGLLDGVVASGAVGSAKPGAEIFARARELAGGVAARDCVHVGDRVREDVAGARAAGIEPILLQRAGVRADPAPPGVRVIATLDALG